MSDKNHYLKTELVKMGVWALLPGDCDTWHNQQSSHFFKKYFGLHKGILCICRDGMQHAYIPKSYFSMVHKRIDQINKGNYKNLEKKLAPFYRMKKKAKREITKFALQDYSKVTNKDLARRFVGVRTWIRKLTIFDQFGWIAEEYWESKMEKVLGAAGLQKGTDDFNNVLFTLTKPEEISTTLLEKKAVIEQLIKIKKKQTILRIAAETLAKNFGWMPIFCYGEPWQAGHYAEELKSLKKKSLKELQAEYLRLKNYTKLRNQEVKVLAKKYKISAKDLQIFVDFGLALDARNEAEYFVSYAGSYLVPMYKEIAKRLYSTPNQIRSVYENEMIDCLLGKRDLRELLVEKGNINAFGFSADMRKFYFYSPQETRKIYEHVESYVKNVQGGDEQKGTCASPGKIKGKVRIVPSPEHNNKVKQGDVMITYATTVDYLPAMKKAGAVIAEVGGLTCHAAVVSREFGIPCIVALSNAMKNFKDGEMVEVNATEGTMKRI